MDFIQPTKSQLREKINSKNAFLRYLFSLKENPGDIQTEIDRHWSEVEKHLQAIARLQECSGSVEKDIERTQLELEKLRSKLQTVELVEQYRKLKRQLFI